MSIQKSAQTAIVEADEAEGIYSVDDSSDSNQECILADASKPVEQLVLFYYNLLVHN